MATSTLRTVGGSVMMAIPKPLLEKLGLGPNAKLDLTVEDGRLVAVPRPRPRYSLDELVAQCDPDSPLSEDEQAWLDAPPMGREAL
ncbi:AbrB/MazE/SpoVT family DNA-binding domain-containing protein [Rhizobium sp. G21]|uniref:AbrB/MazE/SpoVT family DNA-binding domain-containing protein n=1 Tax=Rhizobium sp. G21 TaxID=2758439 RepID=UPI001604146E|nr:AbrB/MazE/SpoVT family DNA-binding domain-containing protein [Rhizobium sp. G21]MBB1249958.1 antitoxin [Rhizobium sp. G21]